MAYTPTNWTDNATQANAARLNKLEQGVKAAHETADEALAHSGTSGTRVRESVATSTALPTTGNEAGDARITEDTGHFWVWDGADWVDTGTVAQGTPGDDGDSAYEIAVAGGFLGTEAEWLASLHGEDGAGATWETLTGKPPVIAAGTSTTAARTAIGAGTSSLGLGTGPTTAAAGDHSHTPASIGAATSAQGALAGTAVQPAELAPAIDARTGNGQRPIGRGELVFNVLDYGAVADFTGNPFTGTGTDNAAAFKAAHDACPIGGTVFVPPGRYYLATKWHITKTIKVECGPGGIEPQANTGTELIFAAGVDGVVVGGIGSARPDGTVLGPLKVTSKAQGTPGAGVGILVKNAQRVMVPMGITTQYFGSHGFFVDGSVEGDLTNIGTFTRVHAYGNGGDGIRCEGDDAQANIFIKPDVVANKGWGINVEGSAHNVFDAPHADQQYGSSPGAFRDNGNATKWDHVYSEGGAAMLLDTASLFATVSMSNYGKPVFTDATAGRTALVMDERGTHGEVRVVGRTTGTRYQFEVDGWNGTWATFQKRDATGGFEKLIWSADADGNFAVGGSVMTVPLYLKIGGLFLRNNAGVLEQSTDAATWSPV